MAYNYVNYTTPVPPGAYGNATFNTQLYPSPVPMNQQPQMPQPQQNTVGFVWVQGEAAAKAYPVAPGNSVLLMDSDSPTLYMKSTDNTGKPLPLEIYDLVKREDVIASPKETQPQIDLSEYVKMSDLEAKVKEMIKKALNE